MHKNPITGCTQGVQRLFIDRETADDLIQAQRKPLGSINNSSFVAGYPATLVRDMQSGNRGYPDTGPVWRSPIGNQVGR
jgi:hypothetical protein